MELTYLAEWIAGGGLVILLIYTCFCLLKFAQRLEDAEDERLWQNVLHRDGPESGR
jgi:hypothetical protein